MIPYKHHIVAPTEGVIHVLFGLPETLTVSHILKSSCLPSHRVAMDPLALLGPVPPGGGREGGCQRRIYAIVCLALFWLSFRTLTPVVGF